MISGTTPHECTIAMNTIAQPRLSNHTFGWFKTWSCNSTRFNRPLSGLKDPQPQQTAHH